MPRKRSVPLKLISTLYHALLDNRTRSWRLINGSLRDLLRTCIITGLHFDRQDLVKMYQEFYASFWVGDLEDLYSLAVCSRNTSACEMLEESIGRTPFRIRGRRVCVGSSFHWKLWVVRCSSIDDVDGHVIAVVDRGWESESVAVGGQRYNRRPARIFRFNRYQLRLLNGYNPYARNYPCGGALEPKPVVVDPKEDPDLFRGAREG